MVPVVVVGGTLNALGVVRSLAGGGLPIYLAVHTRWHTAAWSRYCHVVRIPASKDHDLVDGLIELSSKIGEPAVLILTEEKDVQTVSKYYTELEARFHISLPPSDVIQTLADKTLFHEFAEREGLPVPRTISIHGVADLLLLQALKPPVIVKPFNYQLVSNRGVKRAERADTNEKARAIVAEMLEGARGVVVQEWIDGEDSDIFFTLFTCDSNSRMTAVFTGQKLISQPRGVGITAVCTTAGETGIDLVKLTQRFVELVHYKGLGSLEFKRDRKTGRFIIIEPTVGRTDWQEEIATLSGVNIPLAAYWTELGRPFPQPPNELAQVAWRSSIRHRLPAGALPRGTKIVDGHFRLSDPMPALYHYAIEQFIGPIKKRAGYFFSWCADFVGSSKPTSTVETKHTNK